MCFWQISYAFEAAKLINQAGQNMDMPRRLGAEFFGTFWLTFAGCGSAVLAAGFPSLGIGFLGVSFAFGLTVLTMAYAVGHISGGHEHADTPDTVALLRARRERPRRRAG